MTKKTLVMCNWNGPARPARHGTQARLKNVPVVERRSPADIQFEQAAQETFIEDEKLIEKSEGWPGYSLSVLWNAQSGRAVTCSNCMGDLTDAAAREQGKVLGKHQAEAKPDVACPYCGTMNGATAVKCVNCQANLQVPPQPKQAAPQPIASQRRSIGVVGLIAIVALIALCIFVASLFFRTDDVIGQVASVGWTRSVVVEGLVPVERRDFVEDIPDGVSYGDCRQELHHTQDFPAPNSQEVCGTPYTVDTGTGVGEVVQDCRYEVYEDYCAYTVDEWQQVDVVTLTGSDLSPRWPQPQLVTDQRLGSQEEQYEVVFQGDGRQYTYSTSSLNQFEQFAVGSEWVLQVNQLGGVVSVEPPQ